MITIKRTFCPGRGMIRPEELTGYVFSPEAAAHTFIITKMEKVDGQETAVPFDAGTDISCRFIKADGVTELVDGSLVDGSAVVTLSAECYQVPGRFILSIYAETSEETICIYSAASTALAGDTDEVNVSSNTKRTIDAQIDALNDAVENAQEVIDSIPQDYTALSDSVSDLKSNFELSAENDKNILANQTSELPVGLTFVSGRYVNNNTPIGSPTSSTNTISSATAINYSDVDYSFILKSGYKVAFPSFENGVLKGSALSYITTPGEITLSDIKANVSSTKLGTAFAIMIRNSEETEISPNTTNVLNVITKKVYGEIMAFRGTIPANSTLSNYNRAGWYTITQSGITSATDMPNGISSNFRGGILQNYTKIGSASPYTLQRYTDVGTYSQAFERRLNLASDGTVSSATDWNTVQTRLTLATKPTISDAIDFTAELQTGYYRIAANATATNAPAGYDSTIVHEMVSLMDAAGGFTFVVCGTDGMWVKPTGTNVYRRIDDNYKKYGGATWAAIGDSLTDGRYSYDNDGTIVKGTDHTAYYGYVAAKILGFDSITEYGHGGMGWIHAATDTTTLKDIIDDTDLGNPDIITVALGINDRSGGTIGTEESLPDDGSISGAIRYCIETLCYKYPNSQLMLITPINAWDIGTQETGWSKRRNTGRSLDAIADLIKYWCTYYAVKCIDALNECPINVYNVVPLLPDGLHPSIDAHKMIGKWLAGAMPWRN